MKKLFTSLLLLTAALLVCAEDGFMDEHWSQTKPYNNLVPAYLPPETGDTGYEAWGGHVTAGCVATAMAQTMHYWGWPMRYDKSVTVSHSVNLDKGKVRFNVEHTVAPGAPLVYDDSDECKARLTFIAATLGELSFDRDGTGGYVEKVVEKLINDGYYIRPIYDNTTKWDVTLDLLKFNYPVPATIPGHAIVLDGWKRENGTLMYHKNNGQGGVGDGWITQDQISNVYPCFPKKKVVIKKLPIESKLPLTIEWAFPERYKKIYSDKFDGFDLIVKRAKSEDSETINLTSDATSYTFNKLDNGVMYDFTITPRFKNLDCADPSYYVNPESDTATTTINDAALETPIIVAPKTFDASLKGSKFSIRVSPTIKHIGVTPSVFSYTYDKCYYLATYISMEGINGEYTVNIDPIQFLTNSDNYNVVFTFYGDDENGATAYAETVVNFSAANKGTVPGTGEGGGEGSGADSGTEGADPVKLADYILISPNNFMTDWNIYVEGRRKVHPDLTFAVKNSRSIYNNYEGNSPAEKIKAFIVEQANLGAKYFVLGGAWSDNDTIENSDVSFLTESTDGGKYGQELLSLDNTIPGVYVNYGGLIPTDLYYALIDDDYKPDVVVSRIPLVRWPAEDTGLFPTFHDIIINYSLKVAYVDNDNFPGRYRFACAAGQLGSSVSRGDALWPTELHRYADEYYDFFDLKHPDYAIDGEIAARRRFRDYFAKNFPINKGAVVPLSVTVDKFFADSQCWEAIIAKSHGLEDSAYGTGIDDVRFGKANTFIKMGIFAMPCLTGRPDWIVDWNGYTKCLKPSMGIAAICSPAGGEVIGFHNTRNGAGKNDVALVTTCEDPYATQYEKHLLEALCVKKLNAGEAWKEAHRAYIDEFGTGTWHLWTIYESLLYGDPLIKLSEIKEGEKVCGSGALPAKVLFR